MLVIAISVVCIAAIVTAAIVISRSREHARRLILEDLAERPGPVATLVLWEARPASATWPWGRYT